ncbi:taste receptor type 2 member 134-like [Microcaecilia unicolor]|uniref:Taste receptor type 2 n=1 Tax=Microcaecilia unicolor TaxID=1415580 RepID=A0A6P7WHG6_9AMPH|nr:taste receptor type 2 member 134-like [Microcaecilia unicolor]
MTFSAAAMLGVAGAILFLALVANLFILSVLGRPSHSHAPTELILIALALVNAVAGLSNFLWLAVYLLVLCHRLGPWSYQTLDFLILSMASCSFWFTACLSTVYCLKVSSIHLPRLIYLQLRLPLIIPRLLPVIFMMGCIIASPTVVFVQLQVANGTEPHCGDYYEVSRGYEFYLRFFSVFNYMIPWTVQGVSSGGLVFTICHHLRAIMAHRMARPATTAHLRVVKTALALLVLYTICVVMVQVSDSLYITTKKDVNWFVAFSFILLAYAVGCPIILIHGTVRLWRELPSLPCVTKDCYHHTTETGAQPVNLA